MKTKTIGVTVTLCCFPLREWGNWQWGRELSWQLFAVGPLRLNIKRETINR